MKRPLRKATKKMEILGDFFLDKIKTGTPTKKGTYLVYYKPHPPQAMSNFPPAGMKILQYSDKWCGSDHILAWIGPLPTLSLDELVTKNEKISKVYYIASLDEAVKEEYSSGPFVTCLSACCNSGAKKLFIFESNTHIQQPIPLYKWKGEWILLSKEDKKKYGTIIKIRRKKLGI